MKLKIRIIIVILTFVFISNAQDRVPPPPSFDYSIEYIGKGYLLKVRVCNKANNRVFVKTPLNPLYNSDSLSFYFATNDFPRSTYRPFYDAYIKEEAECGSKKGVVISADFESYPFVTIGANSDKQIKFFIPNKTILNKEMIICFEYTRFKNNLVDKKLVGRREMEEKCVHIIFDKKMK